MIMCLQKLKKLFSSVNSFPWLWTKSIDVCDSNQLLIFILATDKNYTIDEELLLAVPLQGTAKGSDIYSSLASVASAHMAALKSVLML